MCLLLDFLPELDPGIGASLLTSPRSAGVTGPFAASELSGLGSLFAFVLTAVYVSVQASWVLATATHPDPSPLAIGWNPATGRCPPGG